MPQDAFQPTTETRPRQDPTPPARRADDATPPEPGFVRRHARAAVVAAVLGVPCIAAGTVYWDHASRFESTDDAFIAARQIAIAPRIAGSLVAVPVTDNQHVAAGDPIARIDDRDYRAALRQSEAQVAAARAGIGNVDAQLAVQQAQIAQNQAQLDQAQAAVVFASQQAGRYGDLAKHGYGAVQMAQQTASELREKQAAVLTAQASLEAAQRQLGVLRAQRASADANLKQAQAQQAQAALNLSYTTIAAAQPGRVVALSAGVGEYVAAGTALAMFVPDEIWVTANFKETQLDAMRPGQPATLRIDAYPDRVIRGHVDSVQPGSGTAFSLLPAENATGNYVKVTQRVPVKIVVDDLPEDVAIGPGMSVVPRVRVDPSPSLYERLRRLL